MYIFFEKGKKRKIKLNWNLWKFPNNKNIFEVMFVGSQNFTTDVIVLSLRITLIKG